MYLTEGRRRLKMREEGYERVQEGRRRLLREKEI
jgi:hypothetical protein